MKRRFLPFLFLSLFAFALTSCIEVAVERPEGFAELESAGQFAAMSPEGMIYRVRVMENLPRQTLEFWTEALDTHLEQEGYVAISADNEFSAGGISGSFSEWTVPYGNDTYKYLTAALVAGDTIAVAEASGIHDVYNLHREAVLKSLETISFEGVEPTKVTLGDSSTPVSAQGAVGRASADMSGCFLRDTPVLTSDGVISIDTLWPGTSLSVYDPLTDSWSERQVMRTIELVYTGQVVTIEAGGRTLEVTGRHPFLVSRGSGLERRRLPEELPALESLSPVAGRWVEARSLQDGDVLFSLSGQQITIDSVSSRDREARVYHLEVDGPHTYAIGAAGIVVHNAGSAESAYKAPVESEHAARERAIIGGGAIPALLPTDAQNERIRVYSGACSLMIDRVEESKRQVADMAENSGGYVEQSSDTRIVIRVPAADFRSTFDRILELGDVLYKAIETYDVTDQFTDPSGRLALAIRARDRLYVLLDRVEEPKERLEILKQIRDYTETIERLELSLKVLEQRIAMSRITVELHSRLAEVDTVDRPIPFVWVGRLHPLYGSTRALGDAAEVTLPDDVAVFEQDGIFRAEAADGTRVRVGSVENDPQGDSLFWQRALLYHLKPKYQEAEGIDLDTASMALFTSKGRDAYYYLVGAIPVPGKDTLVVLEVYFPHKEALDRHFEDLLDAFRRMRTS